MVLAADHYGHLGTLVGGILGILSAFQDPQIALHQ